MALRTLLIALFETFAVTSAQGSVKFKEAALTSD
jgi:hypothetical protein